MAKKTNGSPRPFLAGITGPSGAGKTELACRISRMLDAPICSLDSYYRDLAYMPLEEGVRQNFDDPAAIDHDLFFQQLNSLSCGKAIDKPVYDFVNHVRTYRVEVVKPSKLIIVEGLFVFHWKDVRNLLGLKIYVMADDLICFERRMVRDLRERGRTAESVCRQYASTVRPMAEQYIYPTRAFADLVVSGTDPLDETSTAVVESLAARQSDC
jgi:uridine kinase